MHENALRILLVDDDEDSYVIVGKLLRDTGGLHYVLEWAATFDEGLARIEQGSYAAILIDYRLGARDGLELLDEAVARGLTAPVIMLTGQGGREIDIEAMSRGASDYMAKDNLDSASLERAIRYAVERSRLLADLRQHVAEQERRAEELQRMNDNLEQFVWAASHDLQTPLRTIIYRLQYLQMTHKGDLDEQESIDSTSKAAKHMAILLHDLLHYVKSGSEDFCVAPIDCGPLVAEVMDRFTAAMGAPPQIEIEPLPTLMANGSMLRQVIQNLIQNAAVHAGQETVRIRVSAERDDEGWVFRVEDDGVGIDPAEAELIFQPFRRSGRSSDRPGSGIGLALCRRMVERHGGKIWCEAQQDKGAAFLFSIPDPSSRSSADARHTG